MLGRQAFHRDHNRIGFEFSTPWCALRVWFRINQLRWSIQHVYSDFPMWFDDFGTSVISYIVIPIQLKWLSVSLFMCHLHSFLFSFYSGEIGLTSQDFYFKLTTLFLVQLTHSLTHTSEVHPVLILPFSCILPITKHKQA